MPIGCFITPGRSLDDAVRRVRLAEELGYAAVHVTHINARDALQVLMHYAAHTDRIRLGSGVVPIYSRTPATMAQEAATIDEASGGRLNLGLGVSHRAIVEAWHGSAIDRPVTEMREYVAIVRAILRGEAPPRGERWQSAFMLGGIGPFPDLPIGVAALSPNMLRLAGEIADGVLLWLCTPGYIRDVAVPALREGRRAAGKDLDGFDIAAAVPAALTDDVAGVHAAQRRELLPYFGLPFYRTMIRRSGFADEVAAYDAAAGDVAAMADAISDRFLEALSAVGDERSVRDGIGRYLDAGVTMPCVGPITRTDVEGTLRAAI